MLQEKKWFNHQDPEQLAAIRDAVRLLYSIYVER